MNIKKNRIAATLSMIAVSLSILAGCGQNSSQASQGGATKADNTVRIGYVKILGEAPAIIGQEEGIFQKDGLNAKFFAFSDGPSLYKALASKQIDIGYAGIPQAVAWASRGMDIKVVAKVENGKFGLIAKRTAPEQKVADFRGKSVASVGTGSGNDLLLRGFLLPAAGLTQNDVKIETVPQANMEATVNAGNVNAAFLGDPFLTYASLRNDKIIATTPDPGFVAIARNSFIQDEPNVMKKFIQAHNDSINFLNNDSNQANNDLAKAFNIAPITTGSKTYTPVQIITEARKEMKFASQITTSDLSFYQKLADADFKLGYISNKFQINTIIDKQFS